MMVGKLKKLLIFSALTFLVAIFALPVFAQTKPALDLGLTPVGQNIALGGGDIRVTIARILNIAFGLLGIVMVGIIIYSGFLYMTSGGDPKKTDTARKWIINSVIGAAIVLSSFAITQFVLNSLQSATNAPAGTGTTAGGGGGGIGGSGSIFRIQSITPSGDHAPTGWPRNSTVKVVFNVNIDAGTAGQNLTVTKITGSETNVQGSASVNGLTLEFIPAATCPSPNSDRKCFDADAEFRVNVLGGLKSSDGRTVYCGLGSNCTANFKIGNLIDTTAPAVTMVSPINGGFVPQSVFNMSALATDDTGISKVDFFVDNSPAGTVAANGEKLFSAMKDFNATSFSIGSSHQIKAAAYDADSNLTVSSAAAVTVRAAHCFNGIKDLDEAAIDCGGVDCGACSGTKCNVGSDCSSGVCQNGICVNAPVITGMSPADGAPGNLVTIYGRNFGTAPGTISLNGQPALSGCTDSWSDEQIIMVVPTGASTGKIQVSNKSNLTGQSSADFVVDDIIRPGICTMSPSSGQPGSSYTITGRGLGSVQGSLLFDTRLATVTTWSADGIVGLVPTLTDGRYVATLKVGDQQSNGIYFNILAPAGGIPSIRSVSPDIGPRGEYITIFGTNFGTATGKVVFLKGSASADADISFPEACGLNYWQNDTIIVKVPSGMSDGSAITPGSYEIQVITSDNRSSNQLGFTVNDKTPKPGICKIDPDNGPPGKRVTLVGERFGDVADGKINFWQNKEAETIPGSWSDTSAVTKVPVGANTGPVTLVSAGTLSNAVNFKVADCGADSSICTTDEQCCAGSCIAKSASCTNGPVGSYLWRFATGPIVTVPRVLENQDCSEGLIQSPSPWKGSIDACTNATLSAQFNVSMQTDVPAGATKVEDCTGASGAFDAGACASNPVTIQQTSWNTSSGNENDTLIITTSDLIANHAYQVTLAKTLRSAKNVPMDADYVWRFRTSATGGCALTRVGVSPVKTTITEATQNKDFTAYPAAANCNTLKCSAVFGFTWRTSDTRAEARDARVTSDNLCKATAYPLLETGDVPVNVIALSTIFNKEGRGDLYIKYIPPQIIDFWPSSKCPAACLNADVGGKFNVEMDATTVTSDNIKIYECLEPASYSGTDTCLFPGGIPPTAERTGSVQYGAADKSFSVTLNTADGKLERGKRYLVRVNGFNVKSVSGATLSGLNPAPYFQWQFAVKDNAATCSVDRIDLTPAEATLNLIYSKTGYGAVPYGKPDECNITGPRLRGDVYSWMWDSSKTDVGTIIPASATSTNREVEAVGPGTSDITAKVPQDSPPGAKTSPVSKFNVTCACNADADCASAASEATPSLTPDQVGCSLPPAGNQCCYPRPQVVTVSPERDRTGVCLNAMIQVEFDQIMSTSTGRSLIETCSSENAGCAEVSGLGGTFKSFIKDQHTFIQFYPSQIWAKSQWYRVTLRGVNTSGWKNAHGVIMSQDYSWSWQTGNGICTLNQVSVSPGYYLFQRTNETQEFAADYLSSGVDSQLLAPIPGVYDWRTDWLSNDPTIVGIPPTGNVSNTIGTAQTKNGKAEIVATVTVSGSAVTASAPRTLFGSAQTDVFLCENIWNPSGGDPAGLTDPAFYFRSRYCRDIKSQTVSLLHPSTILNWLSYIYKKAVAQITGQGEQVLNVLPDFKVVSLPGRPEEGILKEYLLQNPENHDAIGIRIATNSAHLSPLRWYFEVKNFKGSPKPIKIDGYEAIQDGRTVYVAAANQDGGGKIFTNIYLVSYNDGASAETQNIFQQILGNLTLNTNLDDKKVCSDGTTACNSDLNCSASKCSGYKSATPGICNTSPQSCGSSADCLQSVCGGAQAEKLGTCNTNGSACNSGTVCPASVCDNYQSGTIGHCNTDPNSTCTNLATSCPDSKCESGRVESMGSCANDNTKQCRVDADCNVASPPQSQNFTLQDAASSAVYGDGKLYVSSTNKIFVFYTSNNSVSQTITTPYSYSNLTFDGTDLWGTRTSCSGFWCFFPSNFIVKYNLTTAVPQEVQLPALANAVTYGNGYIWVLSGANLYKIDSNLNIAPAIVLSIASGNVSSITFGNNSLWISVGSNLYQVNPADGSIQNTSSVAPTTLRQIVFGSDGLWALEGGNSKVDKISLTGGQIQKSIDAPNALAYLTFDGIRYLWTSDLNYSCTFYVCSSSASNLISRIDSIWTQYSSTGQCQNYISPQNGTCGGDSSVSCQTDSACSGVVKSCSGYSAGQLGSCHSTNGAVQCSSNADCANVASCNGYVAHQSGSCSGAGSKVCDTNADCAGVAVCQGNIDAANGTCSVGGASCTSDADCRAATSICNAAKTKLTRDTKRLEDFNDIVTSLEAYKQKNGNYPQLESGTFIRSLAASKWNSWQGTLGNALGAKDLPVDPVNQFRDCARADVTSADGTFAGGNFGETSPGSKIYFSNGNAAATYNFDIVKDGVYRININTQNRGLDLSLKKYSDLQPSAFCSGNGIYHHLKVSVDGSFKGALCNPAADKAQIGVMSIGYLGAGGHSVRIEWDNDWFPNYDGVCGKDKKCTISKKDCATNDDCGGHYDSNLQINNVNLAPAPLDKDTCWSEADKNFVCTYGSRVYQYRNIGGTDYALMSDFEYASDKNTWAGDPIASEIQITNTCNDVPYGNNTAICGDGVVGTGEECELGQSEMISCSSGSRSGVQRQECYKDNQNNCKWENVGQCNVGRCGDGVIQGPAEVCDDGVLNGKYGYCNLTCNGFASYCGDGVINATNGEKCDEGSLNGQYGHCAWDCSGPGPRCGDGVKQAGEKCDGNVDTSATEVLGSCVNVSRSCRINSDCDVAEVLGSCSVGKTGAQCHTNSDCDKPEVMGTCSNSGTLSCKPATATTDCLADDPTWSAGITNQQDFTIAGAGSIVGIGVGGGIIWGTDYPKNLVWIGSLSGNFLTALPFTGGPLNIAIGGGYGAVIRTTAPRLVTAPFTGSTFGTAKTTDLDVLLLDIVSDGQYFYGTDGAKWVFKIDPATGTGLAKYNIGAAPFGITFDGTNLWTADPAQNSISKISLSGVATIYNLGANYNPIDITYNSRDGKLWISDNKNSKIYRFDPATSAISGEKVLSKKPVSIAFENNSGLWVSYGNPASNPVVTDNSVTRFWSRLAGSCINYSAAIGGVCDGYKPAESGVCKDYSAACEPQAGRAYLRDRTCTDSCTWSGWSACKPQGSCGNGVVEPGEECDTGTLDTGGSCVFCKKARCGDGYVEAGVEQCDAGLLNGVKPSNSIYGGTSNYCSSACKLITTTGPYCGDGAIQSAYGEQCDTNNFAGATCEDYNFAEGDNYTAPDGHLQCSSVACTVNVDKCKTCAQVTKDEKGFGWITGKVKLPDGTYVNGATVDLIDESTQQKVSVDTNITHTSAMLFCTGGGCSQAGAFVFPSNLSITNYNVGIATADICRYSISVTYTKPTGELYNATVPLFDFIGVSADVNSGKKTISLDITLQQGATID